MNQGPAITFLAVHLDDSLDDLLLFDLAIRLAGVPIDVLQLLHPQKSGPWLHSTEARNTELRQAVKLLVCDYNLGNAKAPQIIPELRKLFASDPLVVVFSGCRDDEAVALSYGAGAHYFLRKPISVARLQEVARKLYEAVSSGRTELLTALEEYAPPPSACKPGKDEPIKRLGAEPPTLL